MPNTTSAQSVSNYCLKIQILLFFISCTHPSFSTDLSENKKYSISNYYGSDSNHIASNSNCSLTVTEGINDAFEFYYKIGPRSYRESISLNMFQKDNTEVSDKLSYKSISGMQFLVQLSPKLQAPPISFEVRKESKPLTVCQNLSKEPPSTKTIKTFVPSKFHGKDPTRFALIQYCDLSIEGGDPQFFVFPYYVNRDLITQRVRVNQFVASNDQGIPKLEFKDKQIELIQKEPMFRIRFLFMPGIKIILLIAPS